MLSPNRYTDSAVQAQHANEKPWTAEQNVAQPAPEQSVESTPVSAAVQSTPAPPSPEEMAADPTGDHAEKILRADTTLDDETRATAWDVYHTSATPQELVRNLSSISIPNSTKYALLSAKSVTAPTQSNAEKVANALHQMSQIDPALLDMAEKHKHVAKMMIDAAVRDEPRED